jgi:hypothetical protein
VPASLYGALGTVSFVALFANIYKHGWHWPSVFLGSFLTVLLLSLAVPTRQRTGAWTIRYWIALATSCMLGVYRFLL